MALIQVNFLSRTLKRMVPLQVILPADKILGKKEQQAEKKYPTLYLLHGLLGNYTDWVTNTCIQSYAEAKDLAVVMPSGDNSFYVDGLLPNNDYGRFIGEELVEITRKMFPLSRRREDTFIGGLSMGGFGATRNGLKYAETFSCIAALSAAYNMFEAPFDDPSRSVFREDAVLGDLETACKTDKNPRVAFEQLKQRAAAGKAELPKIYMAVGTEDSLLDYNRTLRDFFRDGGADVTYEEAPGRHDWVFWESQIKKVVEWLPLGGSTRGLGSGNVGQL